MVAGLIGAASEVQICHFAHNACWNIPGDFLEIGVFTGALTAGLAGVVSDINRMGQVNKTLFAIDPFNIHADPDREGLYREWLNGKSQFEAYRENTKGVADLITVMGYSESEGAHKFLKGVNLAFAFIDGGHVYDTVLHDLNLAWKHLSVGGWMLAHDYEHDIPDVTRAIHTFWEGMHHWEYEKKHWPELVTIGFCKTGRLA